MGAWDDLEERAARAFGSDDCGTPNTPGKPWTPKTDERPRRSVTAESLRQESDRLRELGSDFHAFMLADAADLVEDLTAERSDAWDEARELREGRFERILTKEREERDRLFCKALVAVLLGRPDGTDLIQAVCTHFIDNRPEGRA